MPAGRVHILSSAFHHRRARRLSDASIRYTCTGVVVSGREWHPGDRGRPPQISQNGGLRRPLRDHVCFSDIWNARLQIASDLIVTTGAWWKSSVFVTFPPVESLQNIARKQDPPYGAVSPISSPDLVAWWNGEWCSVTDCTLHSGSGRRSACASYANLAAAPWSKFRLRSASHTIS